MIDQFLREHTRLFNESKSGILGVFRKTTLDKISSLAEILQYAKENDNRSRQACINLGWMNKDGALNTKNSDLPQEIKDSYPTNTHILKK